MCDVYFYCSKIRHTLFLTSSPHAGAVANITLWLARFLAHFLASFLFLLTKKAFRTFILIATTIVSHRRQGQCCSLVERAHHTSPAGSLLFDDLVFWFFIYFSGLIENECIKCGQRRGCEGRFVFVISFPSIPILVIQLFVYIFQSPSPSQKLEHSHGFEKFR